MRAAVGRGGRVSCAVPQQAPGRSGVGCGNAAGTAASPPAWVCPGQLHHAGAGGPAFSYIIRSFLSCLALALARQHGLWVRERRHRGVARPWMRLTSCRALPSRGQPAAGRARGQAEGRGTPAGRPACKQAAH